jgi:hypothetical protein
MIDSEDTTISLGINPYFCISVWYVIFTDGTELIKKL